MKFQRFLKGTNRLLWYQAKNTQEKKLRLKMSGSGAEDKTPYIWIGIDEIKDPLKIQTTDGVVIE